jgi:probable blue pigment (indigoidine) exporter
MTSTTITAVGSPPLTSGTGVAALTAATAVAPAVWGSTYLVTTELLPPGHPLFAGLLRALPAGLVALAVSHTLPRGVWWWRAVALGLLNIGILFPLLFVAAERLPGGVAATLAAVQPIIVAGLAVAILREPPSAWRFLWGGVGLVGVALVVLGPDAALDGVGVVGGLGGVASMALGLTLMKRWGRPAGVSTVAFVGWQLTFGGLALVPLTLAIEGAPPTIDGSAALGYLWLGAIGGLLAFVLWFRGIGTLSVTSVAMLVLLSPLVATALGAVVRDETFGALQLAGFAMALAAIVGGQLAPARRVAR